MRAEVVAVRELASQLGIEDQAGLAEIVENPHRHYRSGYRRKKDGSERGLFIPDNSLKKIQWKILEEILSRLPQHPSSHCHTNQSTLTNAQAHLGHSFVSACDLAKCFPSVRPWQVAAVFRKLVIDDGLISLLVTLCTFRRQLPQGAPTSSALLDGVLYPLDEQLNQSAGRRGIRYSRYVDDLTFSANYSPRSFVRGAVRGLVEAAGFRLAVQKTHHWRRPQIPVVTGIEIGKALGPQRSLLKSIQRHLTRLEQGQEINGKELRSLQGKLAWVQSLSPYMAEKLHKRLTAVILAKGSGS